MAAAAGVGQQWVLVEMVQAFYEVRSGARVLGALRQSEQGSWHLLPVLGGGCAGVISVLTLSEPGGVPVVF